MREYGKVWAENGQCMGGTGQRMAKYGRIMGRV